jgi:GNAT superfamily N-acetyltransferase
MVDFISNDSMISYRLMTHTDIPAGLALCRAAGWNQQARDWQLFLHLSPRGCVVAVHEGKVVGTVATIRYQDFFSWIGMVLVDAACRRQGIGMQLMKEALYILRNEQTVKLDATPAGREVYLKLGFTEEYLLSRMVYMNIVKSWQVSDARSMNKNDLDRIGEFDVTLFGADRRPLLEWMYEGAPQYAFVIEEKNKIQGYCLGRPGFNFTHIGPVVAHDAQYAKKLVSAVLSNCICSAAVLDISHFDFEWKAWLTSTGFTEQRPFFRMYRGSNNFIGMLNKQFAISGPEFG